MLEELKRYSIKIEKVETKEGCWNTLKVLIYDNGQLIGSYDRNYSTLYGTFLPFKQNGKHYALFSSCYSATSVMELPSCKVIATETERGFCPTGYYVPCVEDSVLEEDDEHSNYRYKVIGPNGNFGFVCGCFWGDDSSWKIQFLDLSKISEGIISRDDRFGYIELLGSHEELEKAINVEPYSQEEYDQNDVFIEIACRRTFRYPKFEEA